MSITFEVLATTDLPSTTLAILVLGVDARQDAVAQGQSETHAELSLLASASIEESSGVSVKIPNTCNAILQLGVLASGTITIASSSNAGLGLAVVSYESHGIEGETFTTGELSLAVDAQEAAKLTAYGFMVEQSPYISAAGGKWYQSTRETVGAGAASTELATAVLKSAMSAAAARKSKATVTAASADDLVLGEALSVVWFMLTDEGVQLTTAASADYRAVAAVVARLLLTGVVDSYAEAMAAVAAALAFGAIADQMQFEGVTDSVALAAAVADIQTAVVALLESLQAAAAVTATQVAMIVVDEALQLSADAATAAEFAAAVVDSVGLFLSLSLDDGQYIAWALNTETKGATRYTNYPFNSYMQVGGRYYGVASTGLYLLEGEDDAGTEIAARLRLGLSALGNRQQKRLPEGFITYTADGTLLLQVITTDAETEEKVAAIYELPRKSAGAQLSSRWKPGRGLAAVEWDFVIENVDGAAFDITALDWRPINLDRKTRG